jgi:hypothetical protein
MSDLTPEQIERRHLIADVVGVARWLADDPGYTRAMATRDLRRIGQKYNADVWSEDELAQLSGLRVAASTPTPKG